MVNFYIAINRFFDALLGFTESMPPLVPLAIWSVVVGVAAMIIYKYTSSQSGIKDAKDRIKGHFYEVFLYIDDAAVIVKAQGNIMWNAGRYMAYALPPLLIMIALFFPLFANFEMRYGLKPIEPGDATLVKVRLAKYEDGWRNKVKLDLPPEVEMIGAPVRFLRKVTDDGQGAKVLRRDYEINYKLRPKSEGEHMLTFTSAGQTLKVPLIAGHDYGRRIAPVGATTDLGLALLYPPAAKVPARSGIERVEIVYPGAEFPFLGWMTWWVWPLLIISMIAALAVKGIFKVEI